MDNKTKSAILVIGVVAVAFLLLSFRSKPKEVPVSTMTQQEKDILFDEAMGYRGGAAPSDEMMEEFRSRQEAALKKIAESGLQAEFDAYKKIQDELPPRP